MSVDLEILLWWNPEAQWSQRWRQLVAAIDTWPTAKGEWEATLRKSGSESAAPWAVGEPLPEDNRLMSGFHIGAWRFNKDGVSRGGVRVGISAWGPKFRQRPNPELDGHAMVHLPAGPFFVPEDSSFSATIEENLELLHGLLEHLAMSLIPDRMAVFTGGGSHHLINAHAVWWASPSAVVKHIQEFQKLWHNGDEDWRIPPLGSPDALQYSSEFHELRNAANRVELQEEFRSVVDASPSVEVVADLLASGRFDVFHWSGGAFVFVFPHSLNGFVDGFVLEVLVRSLESSRCAP